MSEELINLKFELMQLQSKMVAATLVGDKSLYERLNEEHNSKLELLSKLSFGDSTIPPSVDDEVLRRLSEWDKALVEDRLSDAKKLIPEATDTGLNPYGKLAAVIKTYCHGRKGRITSNPGIATGKCVSKSAEYMHGLDGALEYPLFIDGKKSEVIAQFNFESYDSGFGFLVRNIDRV